MKNKTLLCLFVFFVLSSFVHAVTIDTVNLNGYKYGSNGTVYSAYFKENSNWGNGVKYCINSINGSKCLYYQPQDLSYKDSVNSQDYLGSIASVQAQVNGNIISYNNIYSNIDLNYTLTKGLMKEFYILNTIPREPSPYLIAPITLDFGGYISYDSDIKMYVNGSDVTQTTFETYEEIVFKYNEDVVFTLPKPYVKMTNDTDRYFNSKYKVRVQSGTIYFYISVPYEWLVSATYPVIIDPSVAPGTYYANTTLLSSGFESTINDNFTNVGTWTRDTTIKRTGLASAKLPASAVATRWLNSTAVNTSNCSFVYVNLYSNDDDIDDADEVWLKVKNSTGSWVNSGTELGLLTEDSFILTKLTLPAGQWNYSNFQISIVNGALLASTENLWIDDVQIICSNPYTVANMSVALNTANFTTTDTTPELNFTGTDPENYSLGYNTVISYTSNFDRGYIDYYNLTDASFQVGKSTGFYFVGQSIEGNNKNLSKLIFKLNKVVSPTGTFTARVYNHTGTFGTSSTATGTILATSDAYSFSNISTDFLDITFKFSGSNIINLTTGNYYVIGIYYNSGGTTYYVNINVMNTGGTHPGNLVFYTTTSGWSYYGEREVLFQAISTEDDIIYDSYSVFDSNFNNTVNSTDTHPFNSGEQIKYTVQDALPLNTYYWRVRANDPTGSNTWSPWSETRQFTIEEESGESTCTYTSGNWNIDCSDNCVISSDTNLGANDIILYGTGSLYVNSLLSFRDLYLVKTTCSIYISKTTGGLMVAK